jgi:pimeloyl-ACP methyl ester carboxylesterase
MLLTGLKFICASIVILAGSGATYQYVGTHLDEQKYLPIGKMVDIGGYKLHVVDQGIGGPTVVVDSGVGCNCLDWSLVQPEIAKFARIIVYDRAGYAWSDESPLDRTNENIVEELRTMLRAIGAPGPYILVGHSFGGSNVQLYAMKYPEEVVGIVLIDSVHEDQLKVLDIPPIELFQLLMGASSLGICRLLSHVPLVRSSMDKHIEKYPLHLQEIYHAQSLKTKFAHALKGEAFFAQENCNRLKEYSGHFEDKPLCVITAGKPLISYERGQAVYTREQIDAINTQWPQLQADLVKKSSRGRHVIAEHSGHMIIADQPEIIIDVVHEMVDELNQVGWK